MTNTRSIAGHSQLPDNIYILLVDSLFQERRTYLIGAVIMSGAIAATFWKTGEPLIAFTAIAFTAVSIVRLLFMYAYQRSSAAIKTRAAARKWEYGYFAGASVSVLLMGVWSFVACVLTTDSFAHVVSFSMTIAFLLGVFGRNFGSSTFVVLQLACAAVPMTAALIAKGDIFYFAFAVLLAPFFLTLKFISERFRDTLLDAIVATHRATALAKRFDTALSNMPHGLCMLNSEGRILVVNERLMELLNIGGWLDVRGWRIARLLRECVRRGALERGDAKRLIRSLKVGPSSDTNEIVFELRGGATLALTHQPMDRGGVVAQVQDISERRRAERTITRMANFDALTDLPNRNQFYDYARPVLESSQRDVGHAVHFIDLDHFKQVNDMLGHSTGDELLREAAKRLRSTLRSRDLAARFGGDEFVVLQADVSSSASAEGLARRLVRELSRPYEIGGEEVVVGVSIGIACSPDHGGDIDELLRNADLALYAVKGAGRGELRFFESDMHERAMSRRKAEINLRKAIEEDELDVHFQPIIGLDEGRIVTCEALLRWQHPERGLMPAGEFIEIAEETGAIVEVGQVVLEKACCACQSWPGDVNVAVNVSPMQFDRSDVPAAVRNALDVSGLAAHRLEIEITESAFLRNVDHVHTALKDLKDLGVSISLDDFGTGYSSLSYLHKFPFDKVKIDRSFVANLTCDSRSLTLLTGAARLSADLGLRVTVEGIETEEQLSLVRSEPFFHEAQGFLFSRAISTDAIGDMLNVRSSGWLEERGRRERRDSGTGHEPGQLVQQGNLRALAV